VRNAAKEKGVGFDIEWQGPVPARIQTDPTRLRQILMNLAGNAIKFTESGGVRIRTGLVESDENGPMLHFSVSDTGPGLEPEARERIFEAFSQADATTTRKYGGTGLGLTISRQLARLLGGNLTVDSLEGHGSTFLLTVATGDLDGVELIEDPAHLAAAPECAEAVDTGREPTQVFLERVRHQQHGSNVLLVEDGEDNRRLISFALKRAGFDVTHAENGAVGVELALASRDAEQIFDVILMDMQMPVMDGYEATATLREAGWNGPIIALTAHAMTGDRRRCLDSGCDDFATKPIDRRQLVETILGNLESKDSPEDEISEEYGAEVREEVAEESAAEERSQKNLRPRSTRSRPKRLESRTKTRRRSHESRLRKRPWTRCRWAKRPWARCR
jgi:Amt family ammonium transporter